MKEKEIRIGTSGWHYNHWYKLFYPDKMPTIEMLAYFTDYFDTVEINNTFYALPQESTFRRWQQTVPRGFIFAVKGSRYITHLKKLIDPEEPLKRFLPLTDLLGEKLGPILFQFPNTWDINLERLRHFLGILPRSRRYAFEFRHPSWHSNSVYALLQEYNAALTIYDFSGRPSPLKLTADFTYVRLHGGPDNGNYSDAELSEWAARIREWSEAGSSVYFYFNNDFHGYAIDNATVLKQKLGLKKEGRAETPAVQRKLY